MANRSEFIRNQLAENPKASASEIQEAWKKAGNKDEFSAALYYQVKRSIAPKKRKRKKSEFEESTISDTYLHIERKVDQLITQATSVNDTKLVESLRNARRIVGSKLV